MGDIIKNELNECENEKRKFEKIIVADKLKVAREIKTISTQELHYDTLNLVLKPKKVSFITTLLNKIKNFFTKF